ncbi:MAG: methylated-DNA--[protein]-cysteine S-methyltransferase [Saprospiraceae bacterium]|nr:methylated-DNA--[protein]-cysteine S-methyltransferase [Saprospiraceae bacterium]
MTTTFAHWTYYESPFGWLCISGNGESVGEIKYMESPPTQFYWPIPDYLQKCAAEIDEYFNHGRQVFTVSIDIRRGTEFQQMIWRKLLQIPYGHTTTYLKIAEEIGDRKAVRAVGGAVGQNPIGILIPCHRVLGSNGDLTGFMWGLERKKILLSVENPNSFGLQQALF